jgi:hypothetical protein
MAAVTTVACRLADDRLEAAAASTSSLMPS